MNAWRRVAKGLLGPRLTAVARIRSRGGERPVWGNLRRTVPFSQQFGFDRGVPIDRFYLHEFLNRHRADITGDVLEIQVSGYTKQFGSHVRTSHTLDIAPQFTPTFQCDLAACETLVPSDAYDCFLLPNTLQHLTAVKPALQQALRILKPGGVILASAAGLMRLTSSSDDFWRLSPAGWRLLAAEVWPGCDVTVTARGNCLAAVAGLYGLAVEELTVEELNADDDRFPVLVTIRCRKPLSLTGRAI